MWCIITYRSNKEESILQLFHVTEGHLDGYRFPFRHPPVTPDKAWQRIAAVDRVHEILPAIVSCSLEGERRSCTFADGAVLKERILAIDPALKRVAYTITDSPFGMEYHHASMQIVADGAGARVLWTTDLKPDGAVGQLTPLFDQLFAQLTERLAAP